MIVDCKIIKNRFFATKMMRYGRKIHSCEDDCLKACFDELGFDAKGYVPTPKSELPAQAYETLKKMSLEKKRTFSRMMTQIARSDGHFGPREQAFVKEILDYCDVPFVQK